MLLRLAHWLKKLWAARVVTLASLDSGPAGPPVALTPTTRRGPVGLFVSRRNAGPPLSPERRSAPPRTSIKLSLPGVETIVAAPPRSFQSGGVNGSTRP